MCVCVGGGGGGGGWGEWGVRGGGVAEFCIQEIQLHKKNLGITWTFTP